LLQPMLAMTLLSPIISRLNLSRLAFQGCGNGPDHFWSDIRRKADCTTRIGIVKRKQHMLLVKSFDVPEHLCRFVIKENTIQLVAEGLTDQAIIQMCPRGNGVPKRPILPWRTILRINSAGLGASGTDFEARCVGSWKVPGDSGKEDCRRTREIQLPSVRTHIAANSNKPKGSTKHALCPGTLPSLPAPIPGPSRSVSPRRTACGWLWAIRH
jgi:hypothetical protein